MEIYYLIFIWSLISGGTAAFFKQDKYKKILVMLNFIPIALVVGLRSEYNGRDTHMYKTIFDTIKDTSWDYIFDVIPRIEKGYLIINKVISCFFESSEYFFLIISFITFLGMGYFFYKNSCNIWISIYVYICSLYVFDPMCIVRQSLAMSIILSGYQFLWKNRLIYFFVIIIASFIHTSSLFFLLLLFFKADKEKVFRRLIEIFIFMVLLWAFFANAFDYIITVVYPYSYYIDSIMVNEIRFGFLRDMILAVVPTMGILYGLKKNMYDEKEKKNAFYLIVVSFFLFFINISVYYNAAILSRILNYLQVFICISIPLALKIFSAKIRYIINIIIVVLGGTYFYLYLNFQHQDDLIQVYRIFN